MQSLGDIAADELNRRIISVDTTAIIDRAQLDTGLPNGTTATVILTVSADGLATWPSPSLDLTPVDRTTELAVTTALTQLGETLTKALPASAVGER